MTIFEKPGKENTDEAVLLALSEARKRGIRQLVVASTTGYTADFFRGEKDMNIVIVRGAFGYNINDPSSNRMSVEKYAELTASGMTIITAAHALSGAERSLSAMFKGAYPVEIIAQTLRMFGQGTKVCVECAAMACDCGAILTGDTVIAVAGTSSGADTVAIIKPVSTNRIMETKIIELLCKPGL